MAEIERLKLEKDSHEQNQSIAAEEISRVDAESAITNDTIGRVEACTPKTHLPVDVFQDEEAQQQVQAMMES